MVSTFEQIQGKSLDANCQPLSANGIEKCFLSFWSGLQSHLSKLQRVDRPDGLHIVQRSQDLLD
jgi:hypothetical protein